MDALRFDHPLVMVRRAASIPMRWRAGLLAVSAALTGALAWSGAFEAMALALVFPVLCFSQSQRLWAGITAFFYYAGALWPVAAASYLFFHFRSVVFGWGIVVLFSTLLSLPWYALWKSEGSAVRGDVPVRLLLALALTALPPIGICGVAHPFTAAGVVLPATGFVGLITVSLAYVLWFHSKPLAMVSLVLASLVAHWTHPPGDPPPPPDWTAINTRFGSYLGTDPVPEFEAAESIQHSALSAKARVIVFGEGVVRRWNEATDLFWDPTLKELRSQGKVILVGAGAAFSRDPLDTNRFRNMIVIRGAMEGQFEQHVPVPLAMWKPWTREGVPLDLAGPATISIKGKRAAIFICYEQLIPWTYLNAAWHGADIFVGSASAYWSQGTPIVGAQNNSFEAWARLFNTPHLTAVNQ